MLADLKRVAERIGLYMNMGKNKILSQTNEEVKIEDKIIEKVHEYTYLGHLKLNRES